MNCFAGPLGSVHNYLAHIALPNVVDYFDVVKSHRESSDRSTPAKYKELRLFINAVESLNNVLEYIYFHEGWHLKSVDLADFRKKFCADNSTQFIAKISDYANAYKHCQRGRFDAGSKTFTRNEKAVHAADLQRTEIAFTVGMSVGRPLLDIQYNFDGIDNEALLGEAFRYWVDYLNAMGK